jgi:hypothetical protein
VAVSAIAQPDLLEIIMPPHKLFDHSISESVTFHASVYLHPPATLQNYTTLHLFRLPNFHISLHAPSPVAHLVSSAPFWRQLGLRPHICGESKILLIRDVPGNIEYVLADTLPSAGVDRVELRVDMEGGLSVSGDLLEVALRRFWTEIAELAPTLGRVGLVQELEKRSEYVTVVAEIMERCRPEGMPEGEVEGKLWSMLLKRIKATEPMMGAQRRFKCNNCSMYPSETATASC